MQRARGQEVCHYYLEKQSVNGILYRTGHTQQTDHIEFLHFQLWVSPPLPHLYRVSPLFPLLYRVSSLLLLLYRVSSLFPFLYRVYQFFLICTGFPHFSLFCTGFPHFSLFYTEFLHFFRSFGYLSAKQGFLISPPSLFCFPTAIKDFQVLYTWFSLYCEGFSYFSLFRTGFFTCFSSFPHLSSLYKAS
jgi:hypothetical protein